MSQYDDNDEEMATLVKGINKDMTDDEVIRVIKYVMKNLPSYNKRKGTNEAMEMILKMFSLSCNIVNLWHSKDNEDGTAFIEETSMSLEDFTNNYLTSKFNVDVFYSNLSFVEFTKNVTLFIKLIESIKPVTRILNKIKYIVLEQNDYYFYDAIQNIENEPSQRTITISDSEYGTKTYFKYDNGGRLFIPCKGTDEGNIYMLLLNLANSNNPNFKLEVGNRLNLNNINVTIGNMTFTLRQAIITLSVISNNQFIRNINSYLNKTANITINKNNAIIEKTDSGIFIKGKNNNTVISNANSYATVIPRLESELKKLFPNENISVKCTDDEQPTYIKLTINHAKNTTIFGAV